MVEIGEEKQFSFYDIIGLLIRVMLSASQT